MGYIIQNRATGNALFGAFKSGPPARIENEFHWPKNGLSHFTLELCLGTFSSTSDRCSAAVLSYISCVAFKYSLGKETMFLSLSSPSQK